MGNSDRFEGRFFLFNDLTFRVGWMAVESVLGKFEHLAEKAQAFARKHWQRALRIRGRIPFSEETFHLVLAGGVGVLGGLVNLFFITRRNR